MGELLEVPGVWGLEGLCASLLGTAVRGSMSKTLDSVWVGDV